MTCTDELGEGRRTRQALALIAGGAAALLLTSAARAQPTSGAPDTFRYRMEVSAPQASEPGVWHAFQGPEGASLVPRSRGTHPEAAFSIMHEEATGGLPFVVLHDQELLTPVWDPEKEYHDGVEVQARSADLVLRDLRWELIRGSSDRRVAGRATDHYVLTASVLMVARPSRGLERLGSDSVRVTSRTDLWIDPALPFSWAPIAVSGSRAVTLGHPVADGGLRTEVAGRLQELGLPLRTQTRITYRPYGDPDFAFGQNARSEVRVTELQPADPPAVPSRFLRYERTSSSQ